MDKLPPLKKWLIQNEMAVFPGPPKTWHQIHALVEQAGYERVKSTIAEVVRKLECEGVGVFRGWYTPDHDPKEWGVLSRKYAWLFAYFFDDLAVGELVDTIALWRKIDRRLSFSEIEGVAWLLGFTVVKGEKRAIRKRIDRRLGR